MRTASNGRMRRTDPVRMLADDIAAIKRDVGELISVGAASTSVRAKETAKLARKQLAGAHTALGESAGRRPLTTIAVSMAAGLVAARLVGWALRR